MGLDSLNVRFIYSWGYGSRNFLYNFIMNP